MNTYKERPKGGNARKAWDYFVKSNNDRTPKEMYYSRSHIDGARWVAYFGSAVSYGNLQHNFKEIESSSLTID